MGFVEQTAAWNLMRCHQIDGGLWEQAESGCKEVQGGAGRRRWVKAGVGGCRRVEAGAP